MPINSEKYSWYGLKKIHTRNLITKKLPAARKFATPLAPNTFFDGPSLITRPNFTQNDLCATSDKNTNLYMYKKQAM